MMGVFSLAVVAGLWHFYRVFGDGRSVRLQGWLVSGLLYHYLNYAYLRSYQLFLDVQYVHQPLD